MAKERKHYERHWIASDSSIKWYQKDNVKARIDKTQQNSWFRLCDDRDEIINHIIIECNKLRKESKTQTKHNWVGKMILWDLWKKFRFDHTNKLYMHNPESVLENETHEILEHDGDTSCNWCALYSHQRIGTGTGGLGNKRTSGDHPNYSIVEIGLKTKKSPGEFRRLAVTQTPVKNHQLMLVWKILDFIKLATVQTGQIIWKKERKKDPNKICIIVFTALQIAWL